MNPGSAYWASTTCHYIGVIVVVKNSLTRHIEVTSIDSTSDIAGKGNARMRMRSDITGSMFTLNKNFHVQFVIIRFDTVVL